MNTTSKIKGCRQRLIATLLIDVLMAVTLHPLIAQQMPARQTAAQRVRAAIDNLPVGGRMTVQTLNGRELHGNLSAIDPESFSMREVDLKTSLTLRYDEVEKVTKDYGRKGFAGRRVSPRRRLIAGLFLLGGLLALIGVVAAVKD
jgi:hypothetical protein